MNHPLQQVEGVLDVKDFCLFALRKWKTLLVFLFSGFLLFGIVKLILMVRDNTSVSVSSLILYGFVGVVIAIFIFILISLFHYQKGGKIHEIHTFFDCYDIFLIGSLYNPIGPNSNAFERFLARLEGYRQPLDAQQEWKLISGRIQALVSQEKKILITGSGPESAIHEAYLQLEKTFQNQPHILLEASNPFYHSEIMSQLKNCNIVLVEKKNESTIKEWDQLYHFLDQCQVQLVGVIVL